MARLSRFERKIRVRGVKLAGQTNLSLPIKDHQLVLAGSTVWDSVGFYPGTPSTQVTIPTGFGGIYSIHAVVHWGIFNSATFFPQIRDGNYFITQLAKNGSVSGDLREARSSDGPKIPATITRQDVFWEAELAENDSIEVLVTCEVCDQQIMNLYAGLYGAAWRFTLEHWLTVRRLGKLV